METNTQFPTQRFSAFAIGVALGLGIATTAYLVTTVAAAPSGLDMARSTLSNTYNTTQEIKTHCEAIVKLVEGTQPSLHQAAVGLGK